MKTKFKLGQEVECLIYGKGVVTEIYSDKNSETDYPVHVKFLLRNNSSYLMEYKTECYTDDGRLYVNVNRTLTPGTWKVEEILPEPTFEKGQPVWFKNYVNDFWKLRYYSHKENNKHFVFTLQEKEGTTHVCEFIKPFEGVDPNE